MEVEPPTGLKRICVRTKEQNVVDAPVASMEMYNLPLDLKIESLHLRRP